MDDINHHRLPSGQKHLQRERELGHDFVSTKQPMGLKGI
jgi:hypothetical protein